jgi:hypothetical protein
MEPVLTKNAANPEIEKRPEGRGNLSLINMKRNNIFKLIVISIIIFISWTIILQYVTAEKYRAVVKISEENSHSNSYSNINQLDYGILQKGNSSTRFISVANEGKHDVYFKVLKTGNISKIMKIDQEDFVLHSNESRELNLYVEIPKETNESIYSGTVIILKLPKIF